ncbi:MAG: chromate transporter [Rhodospirillales bacterium]|nr:chromate transporter [Rhodospirillales bacterium]
MMQTLAHLGGLFATLSLLAFGGGSGVLPAMQVAAVDQYHWLSARDFLQLFAISRAAPGPGSLIVMLIGQRAAGLAGAFVALVAMFAPSSLLVYGLARIWQRARSAVWRQRAEQVLAPLGIGLTFAGAIALLRGTEHDLLAYAITAVSALLMGGTRTHPLVVLAGGAVAMLVLGGR